MNTPVTDQVRDHSGDYLAAVEELEESHAALLETARAAADTLERITLVQSRSASIIQQTAKIVAKDLRAAIAEAENQGGAT